MRAKSQHDQAREARRRNVLDAIRATFVPTDQLVIEHRLGGTLAVGLLREGRLSYITGPVALAFDLPTRGGEILSLEWPLVDAIAAEVPTLGGTEVAVLLTESPLCRLTPSDFDSLVEIGAPWEPFEREAMKSAQVSDPKSSRKGWLNRLLGR